MVTIKRYPNRKLYNTETKQYITLDGIGDLIREGNEIQVTDNATGEDLTALTLTQIILDQERKQSGVLSHSALTSLIRAGGDRLSALQRGLFSPLGLWNQIDEEIKRRVQTLVNRGEMSELDGANLIKKLVDIGAHLREEKSAKEGERLSSSEVENYLRQRQLPSQADVKRLSEQLAELEARLEEMANSQQ